MIDYPLIITWYARVWTVILDQNIVVLTLTVRKFVKVIPDEFGLSKFSKAPYSRRSQCWSIMDEWIFTWKGLAVSHGWQPKHWMIDTYFFHISKVWSDNSYTLHHTTPHSCESADMPQLSRKSHLWCEYPPSCMLSVSDLCTFAPSMKSGCFVLIYDSSAQKKRLPESLH